MIDYVYNYIICFLKNICHKIRCLFHRFSLYPYPRMWSARCDNWGTRLVHSSFHWQMPEAGPRLTCITWRFVIMVMVFPRSFPLNDDILQAFHWTMAFPNVGSCLNQMLSTTSGLVWQIQVEVEMVESVNMWTRPDFFLHHVESILRAIVWERSETLASAPLRYRNLVSHRSQHMEPGETVTAPIISRLFSTRTWKRLEIWKGVLGLPENRINPTL